VKEHAAARSEALARLCDAFGVEVVYAFGSRADDALAWMSGERRDLSPGGSDLDVGVKTPPAVKFGVRDKVRLTL